MGELITDVSGQFIGDVIKSQLDELNSENVTVWLSRNVGNYKSTLCQVP